MTESTREVWARAAAATIARQDQMNIENKGDKLYIPPPWEQRQQHQMKQQEHISSDEQLQLEEDVKLAREAVVRVVRRVGSRPTSRSFLNLVMSLLSAMRSPTVHHLLLAPWHFKVRYGQSVIAEALTGVTEETMVAYVEAVVRGNIDVSRCKDIPVLLPDVHSLRTNRGAVIIRNALKRQCDLSSTAQEEEWAKERLEAALYREYEAEKEAALAGLGTARIALAGGFRARSLSPGCRRDSTRQTDYSRRSNSLSVGIQVVDKSKELPVPTPLDDEDYDTTFITEPPDSSPSIATRLSRKEPIEELAGKDASNHRKSDTPGVGTSPSSSPSTKTNNTPKVTVLPSYISPPEKPSPPIVKICPALSSSDEQAAPTPPLTPLRVSPPSSFNEPPSIEPLSLDQKAPTPPSLPRTLSLNPLGGMFNTPLDRRCVTFVVEYILCSERVMNDRRKSKKVLMELEDGCIKAETMEWIIRGLRSPRAKREMAQRLHGLEFVGPQWGAPMYKTRKGVRCLLKGVASKHEAGTRFVICASSSCSASGANNVPIITGVLSAPSDALTSDTTHDAQPVIDGEVPGLENWVNTNTCGNLDDGCRLWAWVH